MNMHQAVNARVVLVECLSLWPKPVLLSQKAYADFIRLATRQQLLKHTFSFVHITPAVHHLDFYGSLEIEEAINGH